MKLYEKPKAEMVEFEAVESIAVGDITTSDGDNPL